MPHDAPPDIRQSRRQDLHRLTKPFEVNAQIIAPGSAVALARSGEIAQFLDGDVFSSRITLAPMVVAPFTGTRWVVRQDQDGTWGFLNQGQPENSLVATARSVILGSPLAEAGVSPFASSRWLLYRDLIGFRLRPVTRVSGWLGVRDGTLILSDPCDVAGRWIYWDVIPLKDDTTRT